MKNFHTFNSRELEIPIVKKVYELYKQFYQYLQLFPKKDKYVLGAKCEQYIINILELLLRANSLPKEKKLEVIESANTKFDLLKVFIRLTKELKIIDNKKYLTLQSSIQEIGKMFGGWIKSLKK